jgi:hypothetical protein
LAVGVTVGFVTFVLDPALPVLLRPDGAVQIGHQALDAKFESGKPLCR